jgi:hypothetical protein
MFYQSAIGIINQLANNCRAIDACPRLLIFEVLNELVKLAQVLLADPKAYVGVTLAFFLGHQELYAHDFYKPYYQKL